MDKVKENISNNFISIEGARENNLKNINIDIPKYKLVVITGLSGSGKSSLAFETIFAEGQRRYIETFGAYASNFIGGIERPDVDKISGLSPVIAIEQKSTNKNPRSTVGTITEVYDFMRLLYAKVSTAYSFSSGIEMQKLSIPEIMELILEKHNERKVVIMSPLVISRKGSYKSLFNLYQSRGFVSMYVDEEFIEIEKDKILDRYKKHNIDLVIDKLIIKEENRERIEEAIMYSFSESEGMVSIYDIESEEITKYSKNLIDIESGISYQEPSSNTFSFNSPIGACSKCKGLGEEYTPSEELMIPDMSLSLSKGAIKPLGEKRDNQWWSYIDKLSKQFNFDIFKPISEIDKKHINIILYGNDKGEIIENEELTLLFNNFDGGIYRIIKNSFFNSDSEGIKKWAESFMVSISCSKCKGTRLKKESLYFLIGEKNISDLTNMSIEDLQIWFFDIEKYFNDTQKLIANDILREIKDRLGFLTNVGLGYLNLNRKTKSLSGGESQRIRLATQIGTELSGVTYILDEPSIGLHPRDNSKLINSLKKLRDNSNSILVVEHDKEIMLESDYIIDIGPNAGIHGGEIISHGTPTNFLKNNTLTANYLNGKVKFEIPKKRKSTKKWLTLYGAKGNNLKDVTLKIPLGILTCITGVSGSGKSTLINETLYPIISQKLYKSHKFPLPYLKIEGIESIDKIIDIDQSPIGRTPRSNPATYMKVFDLIRTLYSDTNESKIRGFKPGRFSFNVKGGRCEKCEGAGQQTLEMNFLPDIRVLCDSCQGKRYNKETLEIRYKHLSIFDILNLSIEESLKVFENIPNIYIKLKTLMDVGLGYLKLGQSSTTISGGEAQRVKLASELCKRDTGNTLYILDEPTTGLHFQDIQLLYNVIRKLVDKGNTVIVIEHNLDIIKMSDYIIDIGPDGGQNGGTIVAEGTPEQIAKSKSITGVYLKEEL